MTITASSIVRRVVETLQDNTSIRWPVNQLVRYLNDGQREIYKYRPDSMAANVSQTLVAGTKQTLPTGAQRLIDITRNTAGPAVRICSREILDAQVPAWHQLTGVATIQHFMYDIRDPLKYYVYPPATTSASLELVVSSNPTDVTEPADGALYSDVAGNISVQDIYANDLQDYMLYRAYNKDAEYAGNAQRAAGHYAAFANSLGIELKASIQVAPATGGNPNVIGGPAA